MRYFLSFLTLALFGTVNVMYNTGATIMDGKLAGLQFADSDAAAIVSQGGMHLIGGGTISYVFVVFALLAIWWKPLINFIKGSHLPLAIIAVLAFTAPAFAYYDKSDYNESVYVTPNQSSFWIPDVGNNKDSQVQFGSADYLERNKIAAKRFTIPHTKLTNSGTFSDFYVPAGRLIIVDRTPFYREWVAAANRGTSSQDQSFHFESAESINISTGVVIAASVTEEDASKFLYWFGTRPFVIDQSKPESQFQSVIYGYSLADVMDTIVRGRVQSVLASEFGSRTLDNGIAQKAEIMKKVTETVTSEFKAKGITITFVGYAEGLTFDKEVQDAINATFIATRQAQKAIALAPALTTLQAQTNMETQKILASKWGGTLPALPSWIFFTGDAWNSMISWFSSKK